MSKIDPSLQQPPAIQQANSPATPPAVPPAPKVSTRRTVLGCLTLVVLVLGTCLGGRFLMRAVFGPDIPGESEARETVRQLLYEWSVGNAGRQYFTVLPDRLYNVTEYHYVTSLGLKRPDGTWKPDGPVTVRFRIKHSTPDGRPVENLWEFVVEENPQGKWLVSDMRLSGR